MAAISFQESEDRVFVYEGGYTNDPRDPGGPTNWGITIKDARMYWMAAATANDVRNMPKSVAQGIYRKRYWDAQRCDELPVGVDFAVFDYGVNSGIGRSGKVLRRVLKLPDNTSKITDEVIAAAKAADPKAVADAIWDERLRFLKSLKTWPHFGGGWGKRVANGKIASEHMIQVSNEHPAPIVVPAAEPCQGKGCVVVDPTTKHGSVTGTVGTTVVVAGTHADNPYVWVAVVIVGLAGAVGAYLWFEHRAKKEQEKPA